MEQEQSTPMERMTAQEHQTAQTEQTVQTAQAGQMPEAVWTVHTHQTPQTGQTPQSVWTVQTAQTPRAAHPAEIPQTTQIAQSAQTPQTPQTAQPPQTPQTPQTAQTPQTPQTPQTAQTPRAAHPAEIPQTTQTAQPPQTPQTAQTPQTEETPQLEQFAQLERTVLEAKTDEAKLSELITASKQWVLRCASETTRRYITDSDDEWSIALSAFHEAVRSFDVDKGSFRGFAAVVIRRRILDYLRSEKRHMGETDVDPAAFEGGMEEPTGTDLQVQQQIARNSAANQAGDLSARTREEIAEAQAIFQPYGFSFYDLADCSPRAEKTKRSCALAVRCLLDDPELMTRLRRTGALPMRDLSSDSRVPRKLLDRHRRYIIAAAELLSGDFPILSAYMDYIRKV